MKKRSGKSKEKAAISAALQPAAALSPQNVVPATTETKHQPASAILKPQRQTGTTLELVNLDAKAVYVAGTFNGWDPQRTPLSRAAKGHWAGDVVLEPGRHEYLFVVDGKWTLDPQAKEQVGNPFGGKNSVIVVAD